MDETGEQDKRQPGALQPPGASPHPRPSPFAKSSQKPGMPHHRARNSVRHAHNGTNRWALSFGLLCRPHSGETWSTPLCDGCQGGRDVIEPN